MLKMSGKSADPHLLTLPGFLKQQLLSWGHCAEKYIRAFINKIILATYMLLILLKHLSIITSY